ncbi:hypothetical protein C8N24_4556 [Solirubrobacter pauli]|uniref:Uncharacterized protein n=1 Tax=Solirubrobacter pauli TaxID=166793 RepID=A0A660L3R3_9ACTN|nr:hypothetical protein [Solirubrobacter pauli]RKQ86543.1 hypothetical protein C8N24_4556 [Solirubrobacter pauli]
MIITAAITEGALVLFWMYLWLVSTIIASYLSERKGYGDRPGLATGLILSIIGTIIWLIIPAKAESKWKTLGPVGRGQKKRAAA